jgi:hypothetical protein
MSILNKRILLFYIILILAICVSKRAIAQKNESGIDEFWQELYIDYTFSKKWSGGLLFNNMYSRKLGNYDWFVESKLAYEANKFLNVELMYRHEFYDVNGVKVQEYRPMLRVSGNTILWNWNIRNRHRIEYRMFEIEETQFRYRTDLTISPNWDWTSFAMNPYLSEEIFVADKRFSRNRIYFGIEGRKGRFIPAIYSLFQSDYYMKDWHNRIILGCRLGIEL